MNYKLALKYGSISGIIIISSFFLWDFLVGHDAESSIGMLVGYASMLLAFTAIFIGLKNYRDKTLGGQITFKQAFFNGLAMVFVASVIYVAGWMIYMPNFAPDFADKYTAGQVAKIQADESLSNLEKEEKRRELEVMMENYKKPEILAAYTFMEIFPLGLLVTIIISVLVRKNKSKTKHE